MRPTARHAEILASMLGPGARVVSTPGLRAPTGPRAQEEPPEQPAEGKVFSLDEDWGDLEAEWGQEEEEQQGEEEPPARRARAGRRERAAARGEEQEGEAVPGEEGPTTH